MSVRFSESLSDLTDLDHAHTDLTMTAVVFCVLGASLPFAKNIVVWYLHSR